MISFTIQKAVPHRQSMYSISMGELVNHQHTKAFCQQSVR
jgi:hypothetical protein